MPLKKKELDELKELLLADKRRILEHLAKIEHDSTEELGDLSGDPADVASVEINSGALAKLGTRERKLLDKIEYSLKKFEDGSYGICELTGEEIPLARLKARPVARFTVEAKAELEKKERGYRDEDDEFSSAWDGDAE
jgi:DnaK suppressor protein